MFFKFFFFPQFQLRWGSLGEGGSGERKSKVQLPPLEGKFHYKWEIPIHLSHGVLSNLAVSYFITGDSVSIFVAVDRPGEPLSVSLHKGDSELPSVCPRLLPQ